MFLFTTFVDAMDHLFRFYETNKVLVGTVLYADQDQSINERKVTCHC